MQLTEKDVKMSDYKCFEGLKGVAAARGESDRDRVLPLVFIVTLSTSSWLHPSGLTEMTSGFRHGTRCTLARLIFCSLPFAVRLCFGRYSCSCLKFPSIGPFQTPFFPFQSFPSYASHQSPHFSLTMTSMLLLFLTSLWGSPEGHMGLQQL